MATDSGLARIQYPSQTEPQPGWYKTTGTVVVGQRVQVVGDLVVPISDDPGTISESRGVELPPVSSAPLAILAIPVWEDVYAETISLNEGRDFDVLENKIHLLTRTPTQVFRVYDLITTTEYVSAWIATKGGAAAESVWAVVPGGVVWPPVMHSGPTLVFAAGPMAAVPFVNVGSAFYPSLMGRPIQRPEKVYWVVGWAGPPKRREHFYFRTWITPTIVRRVMNAAELGAGCWKVWLWVDLELPEETAGSPPFLPEWLGVRYRLVLRWPDEPGRAEGEWVIRRLVAGPTAFQISAEPDPFHGPPWIDLGSPTLWYAQAINTSSPDVWVDFEMELVDLMTGDHITGEEPEMGEWLVPVSVRCWSEPSPMLGVEIVTVR